MHGGSAHAVGAAWPPACVVIQEHPAAPSVNHLVVCRTADQASIWACCWLGGRQPPQRRRFQSQSGSWPTDAGVWDVAISRNLV